MLCLLLVVLVGCDYEQNHTEEPMTAIIERQININEYENGGKEVIITDIITVNDIYKKFSSLTFENTSAPMLFPRYVITFQYEDLETITWHIDENNIISVANGGNAVIVNTAYLYQYVNELFVLWKSQTTFEQSETPNSGTVDTALSDHEKFWQSLNRPDISSVGTTLQSQHESFIGYVEEVTFDSLDNRDGYLLLKRSVNDSGESEIMSLRFRLTSAPPGLAGGGTKSEMSLSQLSIGELVVVYFTHMGEAVWVAYPESRDFDAPNLLR